VIECQRHGGARTGAGRQPQEDFMPTAGTLQIDNDAGKHSYVLEYEH
jgi:hypothetical protein